MPEWMYADELPFDMHPQGCTCGGCYAMTDPEPENDKIALDEDGTCPLCFGDGKYDLDPERPCPECDGTGKVW